MAAASQQAKDNTNHAPESDQDDVVRCDGRGGNNEDPGSRANT